MDELDYDTKVRTHEGNFSGFMKTVRNREPNIYHYVTHKININKCDRHFKAAVYEEDI